MALGNVGGSMLITQRFTEAMHKICRSHHRHRPGWDMVPACDGISLFSLNGFGGSVGPLKVGFLQPDTMQDNSKLARDGDLGFA